jgi:fumarate hydratase subunit alpha
MKTIKMQAVKERIKSLLIEASFHLPSDVLEKIRHAHTSETFPTAKKILHYILQNADAAIQQRLPLCQDCGSVYIDIQLGKDICLEDLSDIQHVADEAVREVYEECYLRKSIVSDPLFERKNTAENTPAIVSIGTCREHEIKIKVSLKGGGSENCSFLIMLNPSLSKASIIDLVKDTVKENASKCCAPVVVGIGIGSVASEVLKLSRIASFRELSTDNPDKRYADLERKILEEVNKTRVGPQGLGGDTTALKVNIEHRPCHMATLPFAISLNCHSLRRASAKISPP